MQVDNDYAMTQKLRIFHYKIFSEFEIDLFYKREIIVFYIFVRWLTCVKLYHKKIYKSLWKYYFENKFLLLQ